MTEPPLANLLRQSGVVSGPAVDRLLLQASEQQIPLWDLLLGLADLPEDALADAFAGRLSIPRLRLASIQPDAAALSAVPVRR